jgi:preprotein translocase subunit SecA
MTANAVQIPSIDHFHWYPPRNASLTPWFSLQGWMRLAMHHLGVTGHSQWKAVQELHLRLPQNPADVSMPDAKAIHTARAWVLHAQSAPQSDQSIQMRTMCLETVARIACVTQRQRASFPQLLAALAMTQGTLIQMSPGEGKTLAIGLSAVLMAWTGKPLHIVTANDYLAERDAILMTPLYRASGVTVAAITHETPAHSYASCYRHSVVYATAKQLLADFLRDDLVVNGARDPVRRKLWRMASNMSDRHPVMRGLHAAIIDEADGVLIDEATTPLIIASPEEDKSNMLDAIRKARVLVDDLIVGTHYTLHTKSGNAVHFTEEGQERIAALSTAFSMYWQVPTRREDIFSLALLARDVYQLDRHFIIQDGEVIIVDEGTGRSMPGRSWSHGVHQSIEARVGVDLTALTKISARMTFQEFFRHYHRLSGASGTLNGLDWELWTTYGLLIQRVPPNTPSRLQTLPKQTFLTRDQKLDAFVKRIEALHAARLPVLVGTRRITDSENIATILKDKGYQCTVLNAKEHAFEAEIIAQAGGWQCITVATNMAGRGTDIHIAADVAAAGGLQVLMFEAHESPRIDWQLFGRAGRQGAMGSAQAYVSLEEELIVKYMPFWLKPISASVPSGLTRSKVHAMQWVSQKNAQRIATRQRRQLAFLQTQLREQLGFSKA